MSQTLEGPCCPPFPDTPIQTFDLIGCSVSSFLQVAGAIETVGLPQVFCLGIVPRRSPCKQCLAYQPHTLGSSFFPVSLLWHHLQERKCQLFNHVQLCDTMDCSSPGSSIHVIFQAGIFGVGCHFRLQGIFLTQGSNSGIPYCRQTLYHLSHQGSPTYYKKHTTDLRLQ